MNAVTIVGGMKTQRKQLALIGVVHEAREALRELLMDKPRDWCVGARARLRNLPKTNFDLGCSFADQGKWLDALFRFRVAAYFQPEYPLVWYNIGCCYFRLNNDTKAQRALQKALQQNPQQSEAIFMLATINPHALAPSQRPDRMPKEMMNNFFSAVADTYDVNEARNRYQAGKIIHALVVPLVKNAAPVVLDLACGTGIAARPWRATAKEVIGVDSTPAMLALAANATHAEKTLFDRLIEADVTQLPATLADASVDVVQLVNAAHFVGELSGVMQGAARVLVPQGLLVLTVEPHNAATGFGLSAKTGRFAHADAYVKQVAESAGLVLVTQASVQLYPEVPSVAFVFSKDGN